MKKLSVLSIMVVCSFLLGACFDIGMSQAQPFTEELAEEYGQTDPLAEYDRDDDSNKITGDVVAEESPVQNTEDEPLEVIVQPEQTETDVETNYSNLEIFKETLKEALESADYETIDELLVPASWGESAFDVGAYGVGGQAMSHQEALNTVVSWNLAKIMVDISSYVFSSK